MSAPPPPSPTPRILLCGDVLGRLNHLFKRFRTVSKSSGPFDALLCVGQFFPETAEDSAGELSDYLEGRATVPIPTYFTGDYGVGAARVLSVASRLPANRGFKTDGLELCPNLYWLKGSGKFSLRGLSVAYLSGRCSADAEGCGRYSQDDVDALRASAEEPGVIDLFLTNEWPSGVWNRADTSEAPPGVADSSGTDPVVAELVARIMPRYHVAGTKAVFYSREPYSNREAVHVTRFFGLAAVGNRDKQKFIHAISPTPASTMSATDLRAKPPGTTLSPYTVQEKTSQTTESTKRPVGCHSDAQYWRYDVSNKRQRQGGLGGKLLCFSFTSTGSCSRGETCTFRHEMDAREQYLRNVCFDFLSKGKCERGSDCKYVHDFVEEGDNSSQGQHGSQNARSHRRKTEKSCWFCLSSPDVESHLVTSIGESYYCTLAKGPLVPDHVLLMPIEHHPNTLSMSPEAHEEVRRYKNALIKYFKSQGNAVVFFEWISERISHANLQAIPVPLSKESAVKRIFNLAAKKLGFNFAEMIPSNDSQSIELLKSQLNGRSNLFYVELPERTILSYLVDDNERFPVQFGREVIAGLLNIADRADWRNCKLSKEDELQMVQTFKKGFEEFDPC